MYSQVIALFSAFCSSLTILALGIERRKNPGALGVVLFGGALFALATSYLLMLFEAPVGEGVLELLFSLGIVVACSALLWFAIEYAPPGSWHPRLQTLVTLVFPALLVLFTWLTASRIQPGSSPSPDQTRALLELLAIVFSIAVLLLAILILGQMLAGIPLAYRRQIEIAILAMLFPLAGAGMQVLGLEKVVGVHLPFLAFAIAGLLFAYALITYHLLRSRPISRADIVEVLKDGWLFVDQDDRIADLNYTAVRVIGLPRAKILGQKIDSILQNWGNFARNMSSKELEFRGSMQIDSQWKYYNIRTTSVTDRIGRLVGQVITWRDITERRKADAARQQTRDGMFVLLQSIADAASRSLQLSDFLAEAINHIVFSFNSRVCMVFMLDEKFEKENDNSYHLAGSHGLSDQMLQQVSTLFNEYQNSGIFENLEPVLIEATGADERIPEPFRVLGNLCLFAAPMIAENEYIGWLLLARTSETPFEPDEFARLKIVTEELSNRIHNFRRFQTKVAVEERQRLVRDLHDAVSQKLYGLVTLTEATKARIEAGEPEIPNDVLRKIGENARQALKEMRLFLYELQPVDLEQGLVASLHHRLGAVEGRADVRARLLADEDIQLGPDKQIALYYISQEALNNVLRHAGAKSVVVRLTQKRVNVHFEIEDDGCGFDLKRASSSDGLGLKNIRERTALMGGKLTIRSSPGKGTKLTVTVPKDSKAKRRRA